MKNCLGTITAVLAALLAGCEETAKPHTDSAVALGEALFVENCAECHPRTGRGDYLKRIPATLISRRSSYELMAWIEGTDQHREMPSFSHLTEEERAALAAYLFTEIMK